MSNNASSVLTFNDAPDSLSRSQRAPPLGRAPSRNRGSVNLVALIAGCVFAAVVLIVILGCIPLYISAATSNTASTSSQQRAGPPCAHCKPRGKAAGALAAVVAPQSAAPQPSSAPRRPGASNAAVPNPTAARTMPPVTTETTSMLVARGKFLEKVSSSKAPSTTHHQNSNSTAVSKPPSIADAFKDAFVPGARARRVAEAAIAAAMTSLPAAAPASGATPFPVDYVMTFVNGQDAEWRAAARDLYARLIAPGAGGRRPSGGVTIFHEPAREPAVPRANDLRDEALFCVLGAARFAPWLRRIYMVSQRPQLPAWWDAVVTDSVVDGSSTAPFAARGRILGVEVVVVHHDTFFDGSMVQQPTYNSCVIESQLATLPDLAEHFIYANDDMLFLQPVHVTDFFTPSGVPVVRLYDTEGRIRGMQSVWGTHLNNMLNAAAELGFPTCYTPDHVAAPLRKSVLAAVCAGVRHRIQTMQQFRGLNDFPVWYVALNAAPAATPRPSLESTYFDNGREFATAMANRDRQGVPWPSMVCINHDFLAAVPSLGRHMGVPQAVTPLLAAGAGPM